MIDTFFALSSAVTVAIIASASSIWEHYMKVKNAKVYGTHKYANEFFRLLMLISISWFFLLCLPEGRESGFVWWGLCFLAGTLVSAGIKKITRSTSQKIWPLNPGQEIIVIPPPKSFLKALYTITFLLEVAMACFFSYIILTSGLSETNLGNNIILIVVTMIFLIGSVLNLQKLRKLL